MIRLALLAALLQFASVAQAGDWFNWFETGGIAAVDAALVVAADSAGNPAGAWTGRYSGDLSGRQLRISVLSHDWGAVSMAEVVVSTEGNFEEYLHADLRPMLSAPGEGEWIDLTVPAGAWTATPGADWSTVNGLVLRVTSHEGSFAVVAFAGLLFMDSQGVEGVVTIAFDDARSDVYEHAFPELKERGLAATVYVIPELIGRDGFLTQQQLYELHRAGWEIGAHGEHPLIWMSDEELERHFRFASQWLAASGFGDRLGYAYPNGLVNERVLERVADWFGTGRTIHAHTNVLGHASRYRLGALSVYPEMRQETLEELVSGAQAGGEWLVIVFHLFSDEPSEPTQFEPQRFAALLDFLEDTGTTVLTASEAWNLNLRVAVCSGEGGPRQLTPYGPGESEADCA